jgi:hypothetical protein
MYFCSSAVTSVLPVESIDAGTMTTFDGRVVGVVMGVVRGVVGPVD